MSTTTTALWSGTSCEPTYAVRPSGERATPWGFATGTWAATSSVAVSITSSLSMSNIPTSSVFASRDKAIPSGVLPRSSVLITLSVAVSITLSWVASSLETYTRRPSGVTMTASGPAGTLIVRRTCPVAVSSTPIVLLP